MKFAYKMQDSSTVVLTIAGELDAFTAPELRPMLDEIASKRVQNIDVDLSELRLVDSSGVGAIVSLFKRVRANDGNLTIKGLRGQPLAIFKLLNLDRVFTLAELT